MTFAEFNKQAREINGGAASLRVEVTSWSYPGGRMTLEFDIWDSRLSQHFQAPEASAALALYAAAKGKAPTETEMEAIGDLEVTA